MSEQAKVLFVNLNKTVHKLIHLSNESDKGDLSYDYAYHVALQQYDKALNDLKKYIKSTELRAQAGGVM
jgi:hypothetical protein